MTPETAPATVAFGAVYATVVGLCVGSFLNVVAWRLPRGESIVRPRSRCPHCSARISARDNVPLLSFVMLRGRCRTCGAAIAWRYPAVEAGCGLLWLASWLMFGPTFDGLLAAVFCSLMLVLAIIDASHLLLPDPLTWGGIGLGLAGSFFVGWTTPRDAVFGAAIGAGALLLLIGLWYLLRRVRGMGLGDVKMLAAVGAFLGIGGTLLTLFLASLIGALAGLLFLVRGRLGWSSRLPFGVFLAIGAVVSLFFGGRLIAAYTSLL
ncbi:MAG: prepilin peptidase [Acidobacteria bacterium]|nr:prepilin peptidase [Acidobacteriota bacterium]MXZ38484.1 prepilin peptidase [Holophagales bacterium]